MFPVCQVFLQLIRHLLFNYQDELLHTRGVFLRETSDCGRIKIEHAHCFPVRINRNDQFRIRSAVAGDMSRKLMHVADKLRLPFPHRRAADTPA